MVRFRPQEVPSWHDQVTPSFPRITRPGPGAESDHPRSAEIGARTKPRLPGSPGPRRPILSSRSRIPIEPDRRTRPCSAASPRPSASSSSRRSSASSCSATSRSTRSRSDWSWPRCTGEARSSSARSRRAGKGWPTIFLLAVAYGVVEEGLACQTLFNPSYFGFNLLREAYIPALGMGVWWTLFVLTLHTVWSICVPIAVIESLVPERATTPWLGWPGLAISAVLYVLGSALVFSGTYQQEHFIAHRPSCSASSSASWR